MARPALAATRAFDIIGYLAEHGDEPFTMAQLTRALGLNQGSAHAILTALADQGFVVRHPVHRTFRLGPALVAFGDAAARANPIVGVAREELGQLADRLGLEALASVRTGRELLVVVRAGRPSADGPARRVGQRYPLVPPLGAVLVAWSSDDARAAWLDDVPATAPSGERARLDQLLADIRAHGYYLGTAARARGAVGEAAEELAAHPHDRARAARLLDRVARLGELEQTWVSDDIDAYLPATVTVPVLRPDGDAAMELVVHGFAEPLTARQLHDVVDAARGAATVIAKRTWGRTPAV